MNIKTWKAFSKQVRNKDIKFLKELNQYNGAILVGGCQRSGTTMISDIIMRGDGVSDLSGPDKELNSALALSGFLSLDKNVRYCFQTTYVNERYDEYFKYWSDNKMVWMIRNPCSVVYSLTRFSERFCLDELFLGCGQFMMDDMDRSKFNKLGLWSLDRIRMACYSYNSKANQALAIIDNLGADNVFVIDYDELVRDKHKILASLFGFLGVSYNADLADAISDKSVGKANNLSKKNISLICELSGGYYSQVRRLVSAR
ncbi:hypothetical protein BJL95_07535 [Methylomonas sp. LWB]|uniref:sulfotransferase family protein n=1 Tax=Methylomonas sp. LWB TaxID=1905845 RepID=UPI0008D9D0F3|nr:sulfotransferase [Methylomonas sp. LWB]OHX36748.1 hypothetical protein BJL95_07535 [Methylomonas sp. LWB]